MLVHEYFDRLTTKEDGVWYPTPYSWALGDLLGFLDLSGRSVLDAGCGSGNLALLAAQSGAQVSASDVSTAALAATGKHARALDMRVDMQLSDGLRYWLEQGRTFDVIVCNPPSFDLLSALRGPHTNPFFNSFLLLDIVRNYPKVLNQKGCLLSAVSGRQNVEFISSILGASGALQPFFLHKKVLFDHSDAIDIDHLIEIGLLGRGADGLHWNAYYFAVFHF
jgi:SAM-dependent methyltransferase